MSCKTDFFFLYREKCRAGTRTQEECLTHKHEALILNFNIGKRKERKKEQLNLILIILAS